MTNTPPAARQFPPPETTGPADPSGSIGPAGPSAPELAGLAALVTGGASGIGAVTGTAPALDGGMQGLRPRPATG